MILTNITNTHNVHNSNPVLINIKKRMLEKKKNLQILDPYFDNMILTSEINCDLIKNLLQALNCTFIPDTVFKFVTNKFIVGIKCMVIKNRDHKLEYDNPDKQLEWDTLYSEEKNHFHIVYFFYSPTYGKIFLRFGNEPNNTIHEIISNIVYNKSNTKHINTCIQIFRKLYINKFINTQI